MAAHAAGVEAQRGEVHAGDEGRADVPRRGAVVAARLGHAARRVPHVLEQGHVRGRLHAGRAAGVDGHLGEEDRPVLLPGRARHPPLVVREGAQGLRRADGDGADDVDVHRRVGVDVERVEVEGAVDRDLRRLPVARVCRHADGRQLAVVARRDVVADPGGVPRREDLGAQLGRARQVEEQLGLAAGAVHHVEPVVLGQVAGRGGHGEQQATVALAHRVLRRQDDRVDREPAHHDPHGVLAALAAGVGHVVRARPGGPGEADGLVRAALHPAHAAEARCLRHVRDGEPVGVQRAVVGEGAAVVVAVLVRSLEAGEHRQPVAVGVDPGRVPRAPDPRLAGVRDVGLVGQHLGRGLEPVVHLEAAALRGHRGREVRGRVPVLPPPRVDQVPRDRVDHRAVGAVALAGDPLGLPPVDGHDVELGGPLVGEVREGGPPRGRERDVAGGQEDGIEVVERQQGPAGLGPEVRHVGGLGALGLVEGELAEPVAVGADHVEPPAAHRRGAALQVVGCVGPDPLPKPGEHHPGPVEGDRGGVDVDQAQARRRRLGAVHQRADLAVGLEDQELAGGCGPEAGPRPQAGHLQGAARRRGPVGAPVGLGRARHEHDGGVEPRTLLLDRGGGLQRGLDGLGLAADHDQRQ